MRKTIFALAFAAVGSQAMAFVPGQTNWFIGIDNRLTMTAGAYQGMANPNYGRLTFLYGHQYDGQPSGEPGPESNHYHAKSPWSYSASGTAQNPIIVPRPSSNFVPEDGTRVALRPGSGATAGLLVSGTQGGSVEWANMDIRAAAWLNRPTASEGEKILFNSGGNQPAGRWTRSLGDAVVAMQLVSITSGLRVWDQSLTKAIDTPGQYLTLGTGDSLFESPVFQVAGNAPENAAFDATFRLIDLNRSAGYSPLGDSGEFQYRFATVPEPGTMIALGLGALALARRRKRA